MACLFVVAGLTPAQQPGAASVGFRNQTNLPILVQGYTIINKTQRPGQILQLKKNGDVAFDANVPGGIRYITIYSANQPAVVLFAISRSPSKSAMFSSTSCNRRIIPKSW